MLILTRCIGDALWIGDDIKVIVVAVNEGQVRLGIDAPRSIAVYRQEIYQQRQQCTSSQQQEHDGSLCESVDIAAEGANGA